MFRSARLWQKSGVIRFTPVLRDGGKMWQKNDLIPSSLLLGDTLACLCLLGTSLLLTDVQTTVMFYLGRDPHPQYVRMGSTA